MPPEWARNEDSANVMTKQVGDGVGVQLPGYYVPGSERLRVCQLNRFLTKGSVFVTKGSVFVNLTYEGLRECQLNKCRQLKKVFTTLFTKRCGLKQVGDGVVFFFFINLKPLKT